MPGRRARCALAVAAGALYYASQPPLSWSPLGLVALAPLLVGLRGAGRREALLLGWLGGTIACTALVSPAVYGAAAGYFALPVPAAVAGALLAAQAYGAIWFGLFAVVAREICVRRRPGPLVALGCAAAWVAADHARSSLGDGVPWVLLAHSQTGSPLLLQLADVAGAAGPSFALAFTSAAIAQALAARRDAAALRRLGLAAALIVGGAAAYGAVQIARWRTVGEGALRIGLVQGAVPDAWRQSLRHAPQTIERLIDLTRSIAPARPHLVVWPENAVSVAVEGNEAAFAALRAALPEGGRVLVGAPRAVAAGSGRASLRNAALLLDAQGELLAAHDKLRLLPWAETAPWPLRSVAGLWPRSPGAYSAGTAATLLEVAGARFAVLICSEDLYADLARDAARAGATFFVDIGNDGWFASRAAREQHLAAAVLRAVETRRFLARATTDGITAVIDPRGAILERAPAEEPATLVGAVTPIASMTVYTRVGDLFAWLCVVAAAALALAPGPLGAPRGGALLDARPGDSPSRPEP